MKKLLRYVFYGAVAGIAMNQIASWLISYVLRLGYYMACPASMPERVGGEMNAVLLQMAFFMLVGMGVGLCVYLAPRFKGKASRRVLLTLPTLLASLTPAAALAACMMG